MADEGNKLSEFEELCQQLEAFKKNKKDEFLLLPIEKWMVERLGIKENPKKGGSKKSYFHPLLEKYSGDGNFTIHLIHGCKPKRPMIRKKDFILYFYPRLKKILDLLKQEDFCEEP